MTERPVHWAEGMFLRPHHLQAAHRQLNDAAQTGMKWDLHYNWGLRTIAIDPDALGNHRLVIHSLRARLRDGTLIRVPEDGPLPTLDLRPILERNTSVIVYLALPVLRLGKTNVDRGEETEAPRFRLETQEVEDENDPRNLQRIQRRVLNLRVLAGDEDQAGFEVLELARVQKSAEADVRPQLDRNYIPPILGCDAWEPLQVGILQSIYDRIGQKIDILAGQARTRGIGIEGQGQDAIIIGQLRQLNEAYAFLGVLDFAEGVHPLQAYLELCRLVGKLSIFGETLRPPPLPRYDHDDLGHCFYAVKRYLDMLLDRIVEPEYKVVPFVGHGLRMQVNLEPSWLEAAWELYVGVKSPLPAEECVALVTDTAQLDMKIGSAIRVDEIFVRGEAGLRFLYTAQPPRALPRDPALIYFQVDRGSQQAEWQNVARSLTLALRLNERRLEGSIEGQRTLTARLRSNKTAVLQFTLFVTRATPESITRSAQSTNPNVPASAIPPRGPGGR
jgi:type VI secretion system protein ImpJ